MSFGVYPYGVGPYGTSEDVLPTFTILSISGTVFRVTYSEEMVNNASLLLAANYVVTTLHGVALTPSAVVVQDSNITGVLSVDVTHSGSTLAGKYNLRVMNAQTVGGYTFDVLADTADFLTRGDAPSFEVAAPTGNTVVVTYHQPMLPEATYTPGLGDLSTYDITLNGVSYPVVPTIQSVAENSTSQVTLNVQGMTSLSYQMEISPSDAFLYDGSLLPSASAGFTGTEVGTGTSQIASGKLVLSKMLGDSYGWSFQDTSGNVTSSSTFQTDIWIESPGVDFLPPFGNDIAYTFSFSNGDKQVDVNFMHVSGNPTIQFLSGTANESVELDWTQGENKISLLRNGKGLFYALLWNDIPTLSIAAASVTKNAEILGGSPGAQVLLSSNYQVSNFKINALNVRSTQTAFSATWNYLHGSTFVFNGSAALANDTINTQYGPLTKGWGDSTPATKNDVTVTLNGTPVTISNVNPYMGLITLATPIPYAASGINNVLVDYSWMENPTLPMEKLNTKGLVLNQRGDSTHTRFPFSLALLNKPRKQPKRFGYQHLGFHKKYTASLNRPTTLKLNRNPHHPSVEDLESASKDFNLSYNGEVTPTLASPPWVLTGADAGKVLTGNKSYQLIDNSALTLPTGTSSVYTQNLNLNYNNDIHLSTRIALTSYTLDGVFTGIGFGIHNQNHICLVGMLEINSLKHVGLLKTPGNFFDVNSWDVLASPVGEILEANKISFTTSDLPKGLLADLKFQILSGTQAGTYTIKSVTDFSSGVTHIVTKENFPADFKLYGNDKPKASFQIDWSVLTSYRIFAQFHRNVFQVFLGGSIYGLISSTTPSLPSPTNTHLQLSQDKDQIFWGSFSRKSTNTSEWDFFRVGTTSPLVKKHTQYSSISLEMDSLPETNSWSLTNQYGYVRIKNNQLLLKSNQSSTVFDTSYGYFRDEEFLNPRTHFNVETLLQQDFGVSTSGDTQIQVLDGVKEVTCSTLMYLEGGSPHRKLIELPSISSTMIQSPTQDGWVETNSSATSAIFQKELHLTQTLKTSIHYTKDLSPTSPPFADEGKRVIEARLKITSWTKNGTDLIGPFFGADVGNNPQSGGGDPRRVTLSFKDSSPARVSFVDIDDGLSGYAPIQDYDFDWTDKKQHTYRITADEVAGTVTLVIDDVVQTPSVSLSNFPQTEKNTRAYFGSILIDTLSTSVWESFSVFWDASTSVKRTLGVYLGGDRTDINSWEIPRTDATTEKNETASAVVQEMDWRSPLHVRIHRDPDWGVTVFRPDMALPPYFTGSYATEHTSPSAGWINVETQKLPQKIKTHGSVSFGSMQSSSIVQQRWDYFRYQIFRNSPPNFESPHHMVLNQHHSISSAGFLKDKTVEVVALTSISSTNVSLIPTQINASHIYKIVDGVTTFTENQLVFNPKTQVISLKEGLKFSNTLASVTVHFVVGRPITETYLKAQPFEEIYTLLNEGTPPFEKGLADGHTKEVQSGSQLNYPLHALNNHQSLILNDPHNRIVFKDPATALLDCLEIFESNNGDTEGLLSFFSDETSPIQGLQEFALQGDQFTELQMPAGLVPPLSSYQTLSLSGGSYPALGGVLGPVATKNSPLLTPNQNGSGGTMGLNQQMRLRLVDSATGVLLQKLDL